MEDLEIYEESRQFYYYMKPEGQITSFTHTKLQDKLFEVLKTQSVCLDFELITVLASAGIGLIMGATKIGEKFGTKLYIINPGESVMDSFKFTGIMRKLNIINDLNEI